MQKVVSILKEVVSPGEVEIIDYKVNEEKENHSLEKYKSETSVDINRDLMLDNISNINYYESVTSSQNHENISLNIMEFKNISNASDQV